MTVLGLGEKSLPSGEIRVGFRSGWVRYVAVTAGGAGLLGLVVGVLDLAQRQPAQVFDLLARWGFAWLLGLAAMLLLWDLAKHGLGFISKLADSVQETAVAMNRIADRDDRDRDRMITETSFIGQRLERLTSDLSLQRKEQKEHNDRIEQMMLSLKK